MANTALPRSVGLLELSEMPGLAMLEVCAIAVLFSSLPSHSTNLLL